MSRAAGVELSRAVRARLSVNATLCDNPRSMEIRGKQDGQEEGGSEGRSRSSPDRVMICVPSIGKLPERHGPPRGTGLLRVRGPTEYLVIQAHWGSANGAEAWRGNDCVF